MNYRCKYGEIDIIARSHQDKSIVFVEVKYRSSLRYGLPYEAVDKNKQRKIMLVSKNYINENKLSFESKYRYDVISIYGNDIEYIENAFGGF